MLTEPLREGHEPETSAKPQEKKIQMASIIMKKRKYILKGQIANLYYLRVGVKHVRRRQIERRSTNNVRSVSVNIFLTIDVTLQAWASYGKVARNGEI
jgi:hypothetical protein